MLVARALKNSQLTGGESHAYFGDRTLDPLRRPHVVVIVSQAPIRNCFRNSVPEFSGGVLGDCHRIALGEL